MHKKSHHTAPRHSQTHHNKTSLSYKIKKHFIIANTGFAEFFQTISAFSCNQNKSSIILAVFRLSVQQVCEVHVCIIAPAVNIVPFEEMSYRWRAVGNTVSDLIGLKFKFHTSRFRDKHVTARSRDGNRSGQDSSTGRSSLLKHRQILLSCN